MAIEDMLQGIPLYDDVQDERPSRKRKKNSRKPVVVEDDPSILGSIGSSALSGLSKLANVIDVPDSMFRDVLVGENPFDQLLSPTTDENRNTGRDVLEKWGALDKNQEGFDVGDVAGFGAELVISPTMMFTGPAKALTKAGKTLESAGLAKNAGFLSKNAGKGVRQVNRGTTLREALDWGSADEVVSNYTKARNAAEAGGQTLDELLDMPLGGTNKVTGGLPGWIYSKVTGNAAPEKVVDLGDTYAKYMDAPGQFIKGSLPGRYAAALFDSTTGGKVDPFDQRVERQLHERKIRRGIDANIDKAAQLTEYQKLNAAFKAKPLQSGDFVKAADHASYGQVVGINGDIADVHFKNTADGTEATVQLPLKDLAKAGFESNQYKDLERMSAEHVVGGDDALSAFFDSTLAPVNDLRRTLSDKGGQIGGELQDQTGKFYPRALTEGVATVADDAERGASEFSAKLRTSIPRQEPLTGIEGMTTTIQKITKDPKVFEFVKAGDAEGLDAYLAKNHKDVFKGNPAVVSELDNYEKALKSTDPTEQDQAWQSLNDAFGAKYPGVLEGENLVKPADFRSKLSELHRREFAENMLGQRPGVFKHGMFNNAPLADVFRARDAVGIANAKADQLATTIADLYRNGELKSTKEYADGTVAVGKSLADNSIVTGDAWHGLAQNVAQQLGIPFDDDFAKSLSRMRMPENRAKLLASVAERVQMPDAPNDMLKALDAAQNATKTQWTGMFPAFHVRNKGGGTFQNFVRSAFGARQEKDIASLIGGGEVKGYADVPYIKQKMASSPGLTETEAVKEFLYSIELGKHGSRVDDAISGVENVTAGTGSDELINKMIGADPITPGSVWNKLTGRDGKGSWNPFAMKGMPTKGPDGKWVLRDKTDFNYGRAMEDLGSATELSNRGAAALYLLKQGLEPRRIKELVDAAQVGVSPKNFTEFERKVMKRVFPFYSFSKGVAVSTAKELMDNPGGLTAQTMRAMNRSRDSNEVLPDHISETAAIPLGQAANGDPRYLTGLGLMFEDPAQFFTNPADAIGELISRSSPVVKVPIEMASGESFFQRGGDGGRPLDEMDPVLGRTLANIKGLATGTEQRDPVPTPQWLEMLLSNSPLARYGSTLRTWTDPRKGMGAKAFNTLTGVRINDVSEAAVDSKSDEIARQLLKELGGREFVRSYIPDERKQRLSPEDQKKADALVQLMNQLSIRAKERKAKREAAKKK